ncbi:transglycosylase SLT domain-containing protein [Streptomyces phage Endor2]|uniref:Transglycosylase SLT domain-containing protein n=1 Tax=Streptomyces phage Endor2 TaxID=2740182 RepID=A0A7G4AX58_9CAUD|nr:transglycosylase SLT domain-containing protein [Streptomyces phage Endor2]QMP84598.1 transglycosylase SLT domain-containing protein [Streptomyces phage Endor2]
MHHGKHRARRDGLSIAAGVTALTSALSLGMLGGAVLVDKAKAEPKPAIHDTQPIPKVTVTVTATPTPTPTPSKTAKPTPSPKPKLQTPKQLGKAMAAERGWTGSEWEALEQLWTNESDWNPDAQNPTSTAYGIAQFLDSTWSGYGIPKTSDPERQIEAGLRYIKARYGKPSAALAFWNNRYPHWY